MPVVKPEFLQVEYSKTLVNWIREYYDNYDKAPGKDIESIFLVKREQLKPEIASLLQTYLNNLSENYEEEANINEEYVLDQTINYLKTKGLAFHTQKIQALLDLGEIEEAEKEIASYKEIEKVTSKWINPLDDAYIERALTEDTDYLFKLDGALGQLIGGIKRGYLVSIMGPMKRGKTFYLQEFMFGAITSGLRVAFISLEMTDKEVSTRAYKRMSGFTDSGGEVIFPVFDCQLNQTGDCRMSERTNDIVLVDDEGEVPQYTSDLEYRPCTACRYSSNRDRYKVAVWYEIKNTNILEAKGMIKNAKGFKTMYGKNAMRVLAYPMNSANVKDIERDLDLLEYTENWVPDVLLIDYADILGAEDSRLTGRESTNETWKSLKGMGQKRKCAVIVPTQSNRASIENKHVKQTNTGEDIRKVAHVDIMCVLNQTPVEKRGGIMRVGVIAHRHKMFDEFIQAEVLQQLRAGQPYLDAELVFDGAEE